MKTYTLALYQCWLRLKKILFFAFLTLQASCGYHFQGFYDDQLLKQGIRNVYITPIQNSTYKAGIENVVYNNLIRVLVSHRRVRVVTNQAEADAILTGTVRQAAYSGNAEALVSSLNPQGAGGRLPLQEGYTVSTAYTALLDCQFRLYRMNPRPTDKKEIWSAPFQRSQSFSALNQVDVPGMTSPMINESEFDRVLGEIARNMMDDVHESMLAMF